MNNSVNNQELKKEGMPSPTGYAEKKEEVVVEEEKTDEFGYEKVEGEKKEEVVKNEGEVDVPKDEEKKVEKPATGYGENEESENDDKEAEKQDKKDESEDDGTDQEKIKRELDDVLAELPKTLVKEEVAKFALDNKFSVEQTKNYVERMKQEEAAAIEAREIARKELKSSWKKELIEDKEFGGENFDKNVDTVERLLENSLPNTKKVLTERGAMLPPYIMRDLLGISKLLNPKEKLVNGSPGKSEEKKSFLEDLYE